MPDPDQKPTGGIMKLESFNRIEMMADFCLPKVDPMHAETPRSAIEKVVPEDFSVAVLLCDRKMLDERRGRLFEREVEPVEKSELDIRDANSAKVKMGTVCFTIHKRK